VGSQQTPPRVPDGRSPLWRAQNVFRVITFLYAAVWFAFEVHGYVRPALGWTVITLMAAWTAFTIWRYRYRHGRTNRLVLIDQIVITILFLSNKFILAPEQLTHDVPSVVSVWETSMPLAAAVQWGMIGGGVSGLLAALYNLELRAFPPDSNLLTNMVLLVGAGLLVGLAADTARTSTERLARALRAESATAERERLARSIHDNVLQVLARVRRRGNELGGEAAELARLAGEQEIALRSLVAAPPESSENGDIDLAARLRVLRTASVDVSVPATNVLLPEPVASDLFAFVREALENVDRHAGPAAHAWVLLEDLGSEVVISVRDNGKGIADGRLAEAASEGRMGVAQSIRGRISSLGGNIALDTAPGEGTEWEVRVPRPSSAGETERRKGVTR
jgi:signal transduction histidine kinase